MAGFETVVRPVIFPNIRPARARSLAPDDDPDQGKCIISGSSTGSFTISYSATTSATRSGARETKRRYDTARIHESTIGPGGLTRSTRAGETPTGAYIDVEVVNKLWLAGKERFTRIYTPMQETANIEILERNMVRTTNE